MGLSYHDSLSLLRFIQKRQSYPCTKWRCSSKKMEISIRRAIRQINLLYAFMIEIKRAGAQAG